MTSHLILTAAAAALLVVALGPALATGEVVNPHVGTDRSVDTRSAKTIVRSLIKDGMSEEAKALAIFHWLRRALFHSGPEEPLRHDFNNMISIFGYGSCYMQTHPLSHLFQQLGWPCRDWLHDGHHMIEVHYDGAWHCFDPHMTFYVYNRAKPRSIASVAELRADRTLAFDAVKEQRTGPAFLICGDTPKWFAPGGRWVQHRDFRPHIGSDREFGAIRLPRGTRYVRTWKAGRFYKPHAFGQGDIGPYHTCGTASDRRDKVNFPFWEPYLWRGKRTSHRHHGTGYLIYQPDLRGGGWKDAALRFINLTGDPDTKQPALHPRAGGIEGEAIFFVDCPYIVSGAAIEMKQRRGREGDAISVSVSTSWAGQRRKWTSVAFSGAGAKTAMKADISEAVAGSICGYWVRITIKAEDPKGAGIDSLKIHTDFQLNPYALPYLMPGRNKLTATAGRNDGPWKVRVAWSEGAGWKTPREHKATIKGRSHEATVDVAGKKIPRMEAIEISVDP